MSPDDRYDKALADVFGGVPSTGREKVAASDLRTDLAAHIAQADAGNELSGYQLGAHIASFLEKHGVISDKPTRYAIEDFVGNANAGVGYLHPKLLTGADLAAAVLDRFTLEEPQ